MAPLTFVDTHNMVAYLSKSDASSGFDQIVDFLNAHMIHAKRTAWNEFSCSMASAVICLATGRNFNFSKYIFDSMVRNVDSPSKFLMYLRFLQVIINNQVDDLSSHNTQYTSHALTQKVFANMRRVGKGFSGVETPLFASMMVQPQPQAVEVEEEVEVPTAHAPPSPTPAFSPVPQDPTATPHASPSSPTQEQPTETSESSIPLLNTLLATCATLSQKVAELEQDKHTQALEIIKLKKSVKKLEKKKKSKSSGRMHPNRGKIEAIDADEDITLVDVETQVDMDVELQGRIDQDVSVATKDKKEKLLDELIAQRLHDEKIKKAAAREKQEKMILKELKCFKSSMMTKRKTFIGMLLLSKYKKSILTISGKYQSLKRKPVSIAQARKNMIIYLKNMAGYKMEHFRGMTYDKVRPIFEREYKKVQTLFKPEKDVEEPTKKRVAEETLLQESFKKLKAVEVSSSYSTQETPSNDPKEMSEEDVHNMLEIVPVSEFKVEALQVKYPIVDWEIHSEDDVFWKPQRYMHDPLTWKLYTNCGVHHVSSTRRHDIFMLTEKDYPLSNVVMIMMLSAKLQVEEDSEMTRDLVMKIFMEANKPKSRSLNTSSK
uniref:Synaptobrevin, longin-like domain protein n=1 Tax=Tanacetum cinerariifolium TaxID=118510 RepID=A0A6L2MPI1_TANCI|nr:hypothetical protein [Tanacetum cinerariifolium]